jgi:uncharacterized protein (DUF433 family)
LNLMAAGYTLEQLAARYAVTIEAIEEAIRQKLVAPSGLP